MLTAGSEREARNNGKSFSSCFSRLRHGHGTPYRAGLRRIHRVSETRVQRRRDQPLARAGRQAHARQHEDRRYHHDAQRHVPGDGRAAHRGRQLAAAPEPVCPGRRRHVGACACQRLRGGVPAAGSVLGRSLWPTARSVRVRLGYRDAYRGSHARRDPATRGGAAFGGGNA